LLKLKNGAFLAHLIATNDNKPEANFDLYSDSDTWEIGVFVV